MITFEIMSIFLHATSLGQSLSDSQICLKRPTVFMHYYRKVSEIVKYSFDHIWESNKNGNYYGIW